MAGATKTRFTRYQVIVDAVSLATGQPGKGQAVRAPYGSIVELEADSDQTASLLSAGSIALAKKGELIPRRSIAEVARGYGAVDAVAAQSKVLVQQAVEGDVGFGPAEAFPAGDADEDDPDSSEE